MINFTRFLTLSLATLLSSAFLTALFCIIWDLKHKAQPTLDVALNIFYPCLAGVVVLIILAASPLGDKIASLFVTLRKKNMREDSSIAPIIEHIQHLYREKYGQELEMDVQMMDMPTINGFALGRKTVIVTTGLLKTGSDDEVAAVLAHEAGHLHHGDGRYLLALLAAQIPIFIAAIPLSILLAICAGSAGDAGKEDAGTGALFGIFIILAIICLVPYYFFCWIASLIVQKIISWVEFWTEWPVEYRADRFSAELGYGPAMIEFFERIGDEDIRTLSGFMSKYFYSHPPTALRLDKIERGLLAEAHAGRSDKMTGAA